MAENPRANRVWPAISVLFAVLAWCWPSTNAAKGLMQPNSGQTLLEACGGADGGSPPTEACRAYFRGVLDGLQTGKPHPTRVSFCLPPDLAMDDLVNLYRSESRRFPHVLHVPAARLIAGMVLKFFPCYSARLSARQYSFPVGARRG